MSAGYNWFLIIIAVIISILAIGVALYLLVAFQHPEDKNQAWFPKIVVIFGISLAIWTVLLFPLDVANRKSCPADLSVTACQLAIPAAKLWEACYIMNAIMVFFLIPFTMFYYEADSEMSMSQRWISAGMWEFATAVVIGLILGICYALVGYVEYPIMGMSSGLAPLKAINDTSVPLDRCIVPGVSLTSPVYAGRLCDAINGNVVIENWKQRVTFPVYVIAMSTTAGWTLFMVFAGVGFVALPMDMIRQFLGRPRSTISRSEYIQKAKRLGIRAREIKDLATKLRKEDREMGRGRKWRKNFRMLNSQLAALEEDETALELVFPQGEDPDYMWAVTVILFWLKGLFGCISVVLSLAWLIQTVLYIFVYPPITPFLNDLFTKLDSAFPLFGTVAFAIFCFYLIAVTIKGCMKVGLNLLIFTIHPMKAGATLMSSFLFNVALVLLATTAAIQFCAQAFALYANGSAIGNIFGNQILHLVGIKYLYQLHVFLYAMFSFVGLTIVYLFMRGPDAWKRYKVEDAYAM
ncbi:hypothetical protein WJX72_003814 [[Myrmecia] bisecta]|uniref:LMBR1-like membrane protein n=1 Tax=[Myrmecia] bisecta TaxID=41462 RepID=A0AAW1QPZ6_9CHLO